ncbi:MAG TPA: polysaccharide deacetylase family protein [Micromonosporaceae bacterium]|nr:polysaccharide deacetylase family protein [Micromonosporaceae bacterium]
MIPVRSDRLRAARVGLALLIAVAVAAGAGCAADRDGGPTPATSPTDRVIGTAVGKARTLVLYDTTGAYGALGELYAIQVANLVSHFGTWKAHPVSQYAAGEVSEYTAVVYIGSTYDEPIPAPFLDDVAAGKVPVVWINNNIWQLTARDPTLAGRYGFTLPGFDPAPVATVRYRDTELTRDAGAGELMRILITDPAKAKPVGESVLADGATVPWAVRAANFTYLSELPLTFVSSDDRYLAFTDLLFDVFAPDTAVRHRALVRIEDVGPQSDPAQLRAIADYLSGRRVPFSVAVFAEYNDLAGRYAGGKPVSRRLSDVPKVVEALRYMVERGGTLIMHGYTHGYTASNPYGVSAEDYEFYRAHVDANDQVVLDGPVPEDSTVWAAGRVTAARKEWVAAKLPLPDIFEFPHYTASAVDYRAITPEFTARYERVMYFPGLLSGAEPEAGRSVSQYFPYPVRDVYGRPVIPENLGNVSSAKFNQHGVRSPADLLASAKRQLVVRDGVASFFYHPFLGLEHLPTLVEGIQELGYTFVPAHAAILD